MKPPQWTPQGIDTDKMSKILQVWAMKSTNGSTESNALDLKKKKAGEGREEIQVNPLIHIDGIEQFTMQIRPSLWRKTPQWNPYIFKECQLVRRFF